MRYTKDMLKIIFYGKIYKKMCDLIQDVHILELNKDLWMEH